MDKNRFAMTPPMGWNSWDCYGASVREDEIRANARYMAENLKKFGWHYITVDIQWSEPEAAGTEYRNLAKLCMDEYGRLIPAENRFPSAAGGKGFKPLADYVHSLGLGFAIHILRGIPRQAVYQDLPVKGTNLTCRDAALGNSICAWNMDMYGVNPESPAAQAYYDSIFELYAEWGVDFVKVDDMTFHNWKGEGDFHTEELVMLRRAIDKTGRAIVLSTSPGTHNTNARKALVENANMWRISGDFWDNWESLLKQYRLLTDWNPCMGPGHFPDADMLPIGHLMVRSNHETNTSRWSNFTREELRFMLSLWSIARSPLILGGELTDIDAYSLSLIQNRDMIEIDQASSGNRMVFRRERTGCWTADGDGCKWVGLFNLSDETVSASVLFEELGISGAWKARDIWSGREYPANEELLAVRLLPHEGTVLKIEKA